MFLVLFYCTIDRWNDDDDDNDEKTDDRMTNSMYKSTIHNRMYRNFKYCTILQLLSFVNAENKQANNNRKRKSRWNSK